MQTELAGKIVGKRSLGIWTAASIAIALAIAARLHSTWAAVLWFAAIALWAAYFWPEATEEKSFGWTPRSFSLAGFVIVSAGAALTRLYRLADLPLGAFVDEIFTLNSTLLKLEQPFDPFGHTLAVSKAWGNDHANLFLYLNLPVLKFFGVNYWSTKLLAVIPGVIACAVVFLIAQRVFEERIALATAGFSAAGHW